MKTPNKPFKVIIIGAGVSGLTAANFLYKNGVKEILILEGI
jgi:cation diffusion facilitator CzcD-associated flavoprotein CzcO